ncbi:MAG: hypothetical protein L0H83_08460, partial [Salinisphaera sp.]|nr:hypothetical protein [Salinisphaera sp.]
MTGFARAQAQGQWGALGWELRSVNHRYLDVSLRLPEELRPLEAGFRDQVGALLGRGKVEATLRLRPIDTAAGLTIDRARLDALAAAASEAAAVAAQPGPVDPLRLLSWPGVLQEDSLDADAAGVAARDALHTALQELQAGRAAEGERLATLLRDRARTVAQLAQQVRERLPQVRTAAMEGLRARVAESGLAVDPERVEQALVTAQQRMDVDEEKDPQHSHNTPLGDALALADAAALAE